MAVTPFLAVVTTLGLAGCAGPLSTSVDDTTQVMRSLLTLLTADNQPVCLDSRTRGKPLSIFKTMTESPDAQRRALGWFSPSPLRPQNTLSRRAIIGEESSADPIMLAAPRQSGRPLPRLLQSQLNAAASQLSFDQDDQRVAIGNAANAPLATSHWWVRNRFASSCDPIYTVSNPVVARNVAFVSVTAGHWGTTYAFHKQGDAWSPIGQWASWIY